MMVNRAGMLLFVVAVFIIAIPAVSNAQAVMEPIVMQFNPVENQYDRYMFRMSLAGTVVKPWTAPDDLEIPEFFINTIWEDRLPLNSVTEGMNRHHIQFLRYDVATMNFSTGYNPAGGAAGGPGGGSGLPRGRGGGGGAGSATPNLTGDSLPKFSNMGEGSDQLSLPGSLDIVVPQGNGTSSYGGIGPMQAEGGGDAGNGSGDKAGGYVTNFDISRITTNSIDYVSLKTGQIIDVRGLEVISDYSDAQVNNEEISVDVENIFEWTHMLILPPYPVYIEDFWYAELPLGIPGLPEKVPVKLYYNVLDFRRVLTRRIAVIDMAGLVEFDQYWERKDEDEGKWSKKLRAFGTMSISARYMFDIDKHEVFAIARPMMLVPRNFFKGSATLPGDSREFGGIGTLLNAVWGINNAGLSVTTRMRFFTRLDDKRVLRTSAGQIGPTYERKYLDVTYFAQMEAE